MGAPLTDAAIQKLREMIIAGRYPSGAPHPYLTWTLIGFDSVRFSTVNSRTPSV